MNFLYKNSTVRYKKVFVWLFFIMSIALFLYTIYAFYGEQITRYFSSASTTSQESVDEGSTQYNATGTIIFSAQNPELAAEGTNIITNYRIDAAAPEDGYQYLLPSTNIDRWHFTTAGVDNGYLVYTDNELPSDVENQSKIASFSVLDYDEPKFDIQDLSKEGWYERHLSYSPQQDKLLFIEQENEAEDVAEFYYLNNWQIQLLDLETGDKVTVASGTNPVWYKDTETFLYLSEDGISAYNTNNQESTVLLPTHQEFLELSGGGTYSLSTEIAVSSDGSHLIMTTPYENAIYLYNLTEDGSSIVVDRVNKMQAEPGVSHYSPIVSPDSEYFAVLQTTSVASGHSKAISIGSIDSQRIVDSIDISEFPFDSIVMNGWK